MSFRKVLGADVDRIHEQADALLDSEDAPPSWTLGVTQSAQEIGATSDGVAALTVAERRA
jgi:hypothetical protein